MHTVQGRTREYTEPIDVLEHALRRLMWVEYKRLGQLLAEHALTIPQFYTLVNLTHNEQGCPIGNLADRLFQSNATMTGIIDRLEADRLVARTRGGESDKRKVTVQLTNKGRGLVERAKSTRREHFRRALAKFPPRDVEAFVRLLDTYLNELEKEA